MQTIIALLVMVLIIWLVISLLPVILAFVLIMIGAILLYGLYIRHKLHKITKDQDMNARHDQNNWTYESHSSSPDDIIDVEYSETTESDDSYDQRR